MAEQDTQAPPTIGQQVADAQEQSSGPSQEGGESEYQHLAGMISDLDRRLRILEERYSNLRKKVQLTDQSLIDSEKSYNKELRGFNDEILEVKRSIADFDEKTVMFSGELDGVAKKTDLKVIEKYLSIWNPDMFVTRKELREYLLNKKVRLIEDEYDDDTSQPEKEKSE